MDKITHKVRCEQWIAIVNECLASGMPKTTSIMAYLHNNKDHFQDAIELAYEQTGIMAQAIEKDYYVTMLLRLLSEKMPSLMYCLSSFTTSSKSMMLLRPLTCHIPVSPGLVARRAR